MVSYAKNREPVAGKVRTNVGPRPLYSALGPEKQRRMIGTQRFNLWICSRTLDAGIGGLVGTYWGLGYITIHKSSPSNQS